MEQDKRVFLFNIPIEDQNEFSQKLKNRGYIPVEVGSRQTLRTQLALRFELPKGIVIGEAHIRGDLEIHNVVKYLTSIGMKKEHILAYLTRSEIERLPSGILSFSNAHSMLELLPKIRV